MSFANPYRWALSRLRSIITRTTKLGEGEALGENDEKVCVTLGRLARKARDTGNEALFRTVVLMASEYASRRGFDPKAIFAKVKGTWGDIAGPKPIATCTMCGRLWRPGEAGWVTWNAEDGGWDHEVFATCGAVCGDLLTADNCPGYISFAGDEALGEFLRDRERFPPPRARGREDEDRRS